MAFPTTRWMSLIAGALSILSTADLLPAQIVGVGAITSIGSESDERQRLSQISDTTRAGVRPFRSLSMLAPKRKSYLTVLLPEARFVSNSALPYSLNDGAMWAGRGNNTIYTGGIAVHVRNVRLIVAPQITVSENDAFQTIPYPQHQSSPRNVWANPFHPAESSIDLPLRFGAARLNETDFGQSSLTVNVRGVGVGVSNENVWWGPGQQNAILLSNNAPGFAHAFVRTEDGLQTRAGRFDAQWLWGQLQESRFFDTDTTNDARSLNGLLVSYSPARFRGFSVGLSRLVISPMPDGRVRASDAFAVFRDVGHPNTNDADIANGLGSDQITAVSLRLIVPESRFESYAEWARFEFPRSLRDLMESPGHSQGYTVGLQWAREVRGGATLRLAGEGTFLEPDASIRLRPVATSYTSRSVVQGFTHRGQALGAAIGPGSSSQWLEADIFGSRFRFGGYFSRIRWDNATLWTPIVPQVKNEDVSILGGLKGSYTLGGTRVALEFSQAARLGYLFQDKIADYDRGTHSGVDILNRTLSITITTAVWR